MFLERQLNKFIVTTIEKAKGIIVSKLNELQVFDNHRVDYPKIIIYSLVKDVMINQLV